MTSDEKLTKAVTPKVLEDYHNSRVAPFLNGAAHTGFTPIGTIISVMGTTAPQNYLSCDGTVYNIADYPELANYFEEQFESKNYFGGDGTTTFAVPDLRGEFLRGTGTNSHANQGSGANVGVHQDGTEIPSFSAYDEPYKSMEITTGIVSKKDSEISSGSERYVSNTYKNEGSTYNLFTSRPTNTSVLYCIAAKNIYVDARFDYSAEEKVVGTWIDGKPVYQKTYTGNIDSSIIGWHSIDDDTTKVYISGSGVAIRSAGDMLDIQYSNCISLGKVNNKLSYGIISQEGRDIFSGGTYNFTIQYTKTS